MITAPLLAVLGAAAATGLLLGPPRRPVAAGAASPEPGDDHPDASPALPPVPGLAGGACGAVLVWLVVGGPLGAALGVAVGAVLLRRAARPRTTPVPAGQLALLAGLVLSAVEAGAPPARALAAAGSALPGVAADDLRRAVDRLDIGDDPAAVWRDLAATPALAPLARAFERAHVTGASVSGVLTRLAIDLERGRRTEAEIAARSVGVRAAVPLGLCLLPSFLLLGVVPLAVGLLASVTG